KRSAVTGTPSFSLSSGNPYLKSRLLDWHSTNGIEGWVGLYYPLGAQRQWLRRANAARYGKTTRRQGACMDRHVSTSHGEVIREDLLNLLAQSESVPLTLLLAPPGSGKSTLLKHWQQRPSRYAKIYVSVPLREAN